MNIELNIVNITEQKIPASKQIKQAILDVLITKKIKVDVIIGLKVVGKSAIKKLNREFRHLDKPTDVLSFPIYEITPKKADHPLLLGDIVICPECSEKDFLFLVAHGTKHLLGYHHR